MPSRLGRTAAPGDCDWFDPYGVAVGVGRSATVSVPDPPRVALDVGRSVTAVLRSGPPWPCAPAPFVSDVLGVGRSREDEDTVAAVRRSDV